MLFLLCVCVSFQQSHFVPVCKDRRLYDGCHVPLDRRLRPEIPLPNQTGRREFWLKAIFQPWLEIQ